MDNRIIVIRNEVKRAIIGKDAVIDRVLTAILAGGHILIDDIPGVGKTTMALAFSKAMGLKFNRVQFTPDVLPSDITGFTMYNKEAGKFSDVQGAAACNFLLADEINRTSSKTQSALLQIMQEGKVTVDSHTYKLPDPFVVMATQNPIGAVGTQMLPEAQLDRFMIQVSMGYPDTKSQLQILKDRSSADPLDQIRAVISAPDIVQMKQQVKVTYVDDKIYMYITALAEATRRHELIKLGLSPRGALALADMAKADAFMKGMNFVTPENVQAVFRDVCSHRIILHPKAQLTETTKDKILTGILEQVKAPR